MQFSWRLVVPTLMLGLGLTACRTTPTSTVRDATTSGTPSSAPPVNTAALALLNTYCSDCHADNDTTKEPFLAAATDADNWAAIQKLAPQIYMSLNWESIPATMKKMPNTASAQRKLTAATTDDRHAMMNAMDAIMQAQTLPRLNAWCADCHADNDTTKEPFLAGAADADNWAAVRNLAPQIYASLNWESTAPPVRKMPNTLGAQKKLDAASPNGDRQAIMAVMFAINPQPAPVTPPVVTPVVTPPVTPPDTPPVAPAQDPTPMPAMNSSGAPAP